MPFEYGQEDWAGAAPPKDYTPVPAGVYRYVIVGAEVGRTKQNTKDTINLDLQVEDGDYNGRHVFDLWVMPDKAIDTDPEKFKQAMGFLKAKLEAIYNTNVGGNFRIDPNDLLGRRGAVQVSVKSDPRPAEEGGGFYDPKNVVKRYINTDDPAFNTPSPRATAQPVSTPGNGQPPQTPETAGAAPTSAFRL